MRRLIRISAAAVIGAGALAFGGCHRNSDGESFRRPSDRMMQVERNEQWSRDQLPMNSGGSGGGTFDPGRIEHGDQTPLGVPQPDETLRARAPNGKGPEQPGVGLPSGGGRARPEIPNEPLPPAVNVKPPTHGVTK